MKILYVTTIGGTMVFFVDLIKELIERGDSVDIACNSNLSPVPAVLSELGCKVYDMPWSRSPFTFGNIRSISELRKCVLSGHYDVVHCHTPIASACARIACRKMRKRGLRVFYTAHGFHFYKDAPLLNWAVYYPVEKLCSRWTDLLITINQEDFERAQGFHCERVEHVFGVGVDVRKFAPNLVSRDKIQKLKKRLDIDDNDVVLLSIGELNQNKNHQIVLKAMSQLRNKNLKYLIAGEGDGRGYLEALANELGLRGQLILLGYQDDIPSLLAVADLYIHPSLREGLPVSLMEAMFMGKKCVASDIRGCCDLLKKHYLFDPNSDKDVARVVSTHLFKDKSSEDGYAVNCSAMTSEKIISRMKDLYKELLQDNKDAS